MSPIEILWITLTLVFGFVGMARGYPRELGVTTMALIGIWVLGQLVQPGLKFLDSQVGAAVGVRVTEGPNGDLIQFLAHAAVFLLIVFASYAGETFSFPGKPRKGRIGSLISFGNGLINGYLINGTIWYYLDRFGYPLQRWGLVQPQLSQTAQQMVKYLPPQVIERTVLMGIIAIMLLLRVRK